MIYILTGDIRTGKTTALLHWANDRIDVDGLLCPDGNNGKRYFLKIKAGEKFELEVESEVDNIVEIGNFKFLKSAFNKANDFLVSLAEKKENNYLIIDEIGKLELKNEGLHLSAEALVEKFKIDKKRHLILVVREYLLDAVIEHYQISDYIVLKKEDLKSLSFRT